MSTTDYNLSGTVGSEGLNVRPSCDGRPFHRLGVVRRFQGVSRRAIAQGLNIDVSMVKQQEEETSDLRLSTLYKWQHLLEVPVAELLVDDDAPLSPPVMKRARMVRMMKTVLSIIERSNHPLIRRMAQNLARQMVDLMPELKGVTAGHAVGLRRGLNEYGRAADRRFSLDGLRALSCGRPMHSVD
jgi:transcriptional regulator with XRE-family HTH domain